MLDTLARWRHGPPIFFRLLCAIFLVVGLFACGSPAIDLKLLMSLNPQARVELSCHRVIGDPGQLQFGVHNEDTNEVIMEDRPEWLLEAVKTTEVITHYIPDSAACTRNGAQARKPGRVQLGVIWTLSSPPHDFTELRLSSSVRDALESSLARASNAEPEYINKVFLGQVMTGRNGRLTLQQADEITQTLRQALRGHVNELIQYGPLGRAFPRPKPPSNATTVEPIDAPQAQFAGGAIGAIPEAVTPGGAIITQALIEQGVLPRGTREAQAGKAVTEIVVGVGQVFIGADGAIIGGGMSLTGGGAVAGVPLCIGSLALATNGVATALNGVKSLSIVLCHWNDEPAAAASAPAESAASPAPASTAAPAAAPAPTAGSSTPSTGQTTTPGWKRLGSGKQTGTSTRTWVKSTGQVHHAISKAIHKKLQDHDTLKNVYKLRDERFVTQAVNKEAHKGYQKWHRDMEDKVVEWLKDNDKATPAQFEDYLRDLYQTDQELAWRFPNGL